MAQRECKVIAIIFYVSLFFISGFAMGNEFFKKVNEDFILIDKTVSKLNVYLDGMERENLIPMREDIALANLLSSNVYEYYSSGLSKQNFLKNCYPASVYNRFVLYGEYLSQYERCFEKECENIYKLRNKMLMVVDTIKDDIKICRQELDIILYVK